MSQLGPKQFIYRASCRSVEVRLRVNVDCSWVVIKRPGAVASYIDIAQKDVDDVVSRFTAIKGDPDRFDTFVRSVQTVTVVA